MRKTKYFLGVFLVSLALALLPGRAMAIQEYGDVNRSGGVNIDDVTRLIDDLLAGQTTILDDVNGDLEVNIVDVTVLIDYLLSRKWIFNLYYPPVPDSAMVVTVNGASFAMMPVKGGIYYPYQYGGGSPLGFYVTLSDFYLGMTEVTFELWEAVMGSRPVTSMTYKAKPNQAIEFVSFRDCKAFIARLNELTGMEFRLPTYDQWTYAALGGQWTHGYNYAGSDDIDEVAWYDGNRPDIFERYRQQWSWASYSMPVGMKKPNELGIYDMSGNVFEMIEWSEIGDGENYVELDPESTRNIWRLGGNVIEDVSYCIIHCPSTTNWLLNQDDIRKANGLRLCLQASSLNL